MAGPTLVIEYCPRCGWLLRAAWLAQELLTTFGSELGRVSLVPSERSGTFQIYVESEKEPALLWCRVRDAGFPQPAELKRRVRDHSFPGRPLGHSEPKAAPEA
jgi:selenoprotein W-related protein